MPLEVKRALFKMFLYYLNEHGDITELKHFVKNNKECLKLVEEWNSMVLN